MENKFVAYEYREVEVSKSMADMVGDMVTNFGWEVTSKRVGISKVTYSLKRDYTIPNRDKVVELEKQLFDCVSKVNKLRSTTNERGNVIALTIGLVGTVLVGGATFSYLGGLIALMVGLAVPGFALWGLAPYLNGKINKNNASKVESEVSDLVENIYKLGKQSFELING